ncbi:MAG: type II toxin-antitoxin system Phd/YefM family antitoxin [Burkholderiaceae bacterium]|jgi:PHD/YefM family antitoxin component YafN of YafNO toxin-antitoxin module|nr:type II toxin-antitoxin system Phd/YefM family antitoxin [Burkholderiaceae bacterium]
MINTDVTAFRKNIFSILEHTIKYNQPVNVSTKDGNVVVISEEDYRNLTETLYLTSVPGLKKVIEQGIKTPLSECIPEKEAQW